MPPSARPCEHPTAHQTSPAEAPQTPPHQAPLTPTPAAATLPPRPATATSPPAEPTPAPPTEGRLPPETSTAGILKVAVKQTFIGTQICRTRLSLSGRPMARCWKLSRLLTRLKERLILMV